MTPFTPKTFIVTFALQSQLELSLLKYMTISHKCVILVRKQVYGLTS